MLYVFISKAAGKCPIEFCILYIQIMVNIITSGASGTKGLLDIAVLCILETYTLCFSQVPTNMDRPKIQFCT
jgi:hypothetical protein